MMFLIVIFLKQSLIVSFSLRIITYKQMKLQDLETIKCIYLDRLDEKLKNGILNIKLPIKIVASQTIIFFKVIPSFSKGSLNILTPPLV